MPKVNAPATDFQWPGGNDRVPYWIYTDRSIYQRELERIFKGPT
jgi:hypothetical protein